MIRPNFDEFDERVESTTTTIPPGTAPQSAPAAPAQRRSPVGPASHASPSKPSVPGGQTPPPAAGPWKQRRIERRLFFATACAVAAAVIAAAAGDLRYAVTAEFIVQGPAAPGRRQLLDYLWQRQRSGDILPGWRVEAAAGERLLCHIPTADRADAPRVKQIAADFVSRFEHDNVPPASRYAAAENVLVDIIADLRREIGGLEPAAGDDGADPLDAVRNAEARLSETLEHTRALQRDRAALTAAIHRLRDIPQPLHAVVEPSDRAAAYAKRVDLRHDQEHLTVQLTLCRRALEDVWQAASPRLDRLINVSAELTRVDSLEPAADASRACREQVGEVARVASLYRERLMGFSRRWTEVFVRMQRDASEPHELAVLSSHARLHDRLGDFLFHADKLIDRLHNEVRTLTALADGAAGQHELLSTVKRTLHRLEAEHRQFQFVASDVYTRNNYRLDAAVRSARGLARRVRATMDEIDAELQRQARREKHKQLRAQLASTQAKLEATDRALDGALATLYQQLATLGGLNAAAVDFAAGSAAGEARQRRRQAAEQRLADLSSRLHRVRRLARESQAPATSVRFAGLRSDPTPINLGSRVLWGLTLGIATLFATLALTQPRSCVRRNNRGGRG